MDNLKDAGPTDSAFFGYLYQRPALSPKFLNHCSVGFIGLSRRFPLRLTLAEIRLTSPCSFIWSGHYVLCG